MIERISVIKAPDDEKPFLVIWKPKNLPSAPLREGDSDNALAQAMELYPEIRIVQGKKPCEYGLLHRLDTATDGLIVIACSQKCYDFLCTEQNEGRFVKYYTARCEQIADNAEQLGGFPPVPFTVAACDAGVSVTSYFRAYGEGRKEVRPVTEKSGKAALAKIGKAKLYTTEIIVKESDEKTALAECRITEGYRHQVRCHLAWCGLPVQGDSLYNSRFIQNLSDKKNAENLMFSASKVEFEYPRGDLNSYDRKDTWT